MAPITLALGRPDDLARALPQLQDHQGAQARADRTDDRADGVAAMLFAMPQLTAFLLSAAYVLSGPS